MRKLLTLLCVCLLSLQLLAQTKRVSGTITDKNGKPLSGVSILVKGTTVGALTKDDGSYVLNVPANGKTLVISSVNFETQEVALGSKSAISVSMVSTDQSLEDVVVVGYQVQRKREVNSAVARIDAKQIENIPVQSADRLLQGRVAGAQVIANNGIPGGISQVRIRGVGSINAGNDPLFVVDGIQINGGTNANIQTSTNPIAFLNPNDIESIEVLKDAGATAIYGARGGNGVVLITTKKGKAGKNEVNINAWTGVVSPLRFFETLNSQEYVAARLEAVQNANPRAAASAVRNSVLAEIGLPATTTDAQIAALPTFDWQRAAIRNSTMSAVEASLRGGNDKTTYFVSSSYNKTGAVIDPIDFRRGTFATSLTHKVSKKLSFDVQLNLSTIRQNAPFGGAAGGSQFGNAAFTSPLTLPMNPIRNPDGTFYGLPGSGQAIVGLLGFNSVAVNAFNTNVQNTNNLVGNFGMNYEIIKGLRYTGKYAIDYRLTQAEFYGDPRLDEYVNRRGFASVQSVWNTNFLTFHTLNYAKTIGRHSVSGLAGLEYRSDVNQGINTSAEGFPTPDFRTINSAATPLTSGAFWTASKIFSTFLRANYEYDRRYSIGATIRRDGSSRFGANNRFGTFPSFTFGWNVVNERFMSGSRNWLNELKFRYSFGIVGNDQIGNFDSRGLFGGGRQYAGNPGIGITQLANNTLTWEQRREHNVGMDFSLFKNGRVTGSVDYYSRVNNRLLLPRSLYPSTGFTSYSENVGSVLNRGIEVLLNVKLIDTKDFSWSVTGNLAYNHNELLSLYDTLKVLPGNASLRVGSPLQSWFTTVYAGVNPATGRAMWTDVNGNITYTPLAPRDQRITGTLIPRYTGGFGTRIVFKSLELAADFNYEYGRTVSDGQVNFGSEIANRAFNSLRDVYLNRWTTPGQLTNIPRSFNGNTDFNSAGRFGGNAYLFRADYIRLRNVMIAYNLPREMANSLKITNARFYFQATNLWTYADYPGYDPEFAGTAQGLVPQNKNVTVGIQVGF